MAHMIDLLLVVIVTILWKLDVISIDTVVLVMLIFAVWNSFWKAATEAIRVKRD